MRFLFIFLTCILLYWGQAQGIGRKHKYTGSPRTEVELMNRVLDCLRTKDTVSYYYLFPPFDTLWRMVLHNPDQSPETVKELAKLREHPTVLIDLDPFYNRTIIGGFVQTLHKGEDSGVQWRGIVMQRYELQKQGLSRGMEGLERVAPERFKGYMFVRDMLSSTTFCITITEIQKVNGFYCGGQVLNVLEANDIDEYLARENAERKYFARLKRLAEGHKDDSARSDSVLAFAARARADSVRADSVKKAGMAGIAKPKVDSAKIKRDLLLSSPTADDEASRLRREVVARKYYKGKFDEEIPVELYVRYMRDAKGKVTNYWDALYKFGDMEEYVKLDVSKTPEDKWLFEEPVASMELDLNGKVYTGSWTNGQNQTGYDAELTEKEISQKKISELDQILETGKWGKTDEQKIIEKKDSVEGTAGKEAKKEVKKLTKEERRAQRKKEREEEEKSVAKREEEARKEVQERKKAQQAAEKAPPKEGKDDAPKQEEAPKKPKSDDDEEENLSSQSDG